MNKKACIGVFALTMLMSGAIDGIRNLPSIAIFGQQLIFFFIAASILFLIPVGLISAELCAQSKEESGVYIWSKQAYGSAFGTITAWLQWVNTMVWFPLSLTTLTGTAAYLINPALAKNPVYLVVASLSAFWGMTILNLKGIKQSAKIASFATTIGMVIPMIIIIGLCLLWLFLGKPTALKITHEAISPNFHLQHTWVSLTAIIASFLGLELATVHVKKVSNAQKIFPKALLFSVLLTIVVLGFGSFGVALIVPHQKIILVAGTIQAFNVIFTGLHVAWLEKILGVMLLFGSLGAIINWLISPSKSLAQAAKDSYLPKVLSKENKHGASSNILIFQAVIVSLVSCAFFLMPSVSGSYWLLLDLSTELYVIMYLCMFIAGLKILMNSEKILLIPGGKLSAMAASFVGIIGCLITIVVGFFPPSNINVGGDLHYVTLFAGGVLIMTIPAAVLIVGKKLFVSKPVLEVGYENA
ncbi:MAG: APC family permease [Gammaproteobacteria bacterium]|jgi:amino acid transporter